MYDSSDATAQVVADVASVPMDELPCLVQLPDAWLEKYGHRAPPMENDQRRFPRVACGGLNAKAALEYRSTLPAHPRDEVTWAIYPVSVSRGGMAFLHSEPLYPGEKFFIRLSDEKSYDVEVARCRRVGPRCFEIGARF
jgi:hypothetical protein